MPAPSNFFSGRSVNLLYQNAATPTPLTAAQMSSWATVGPLLAPQYGGSGTSPFMTTALFGLESPVAFGQTAESVTFNQAGQTQGAAIPIQNFPVVQNLVCAANLADPTQLQMYSDGISNSVIRTFFWVVNIGPVGTPTSTWVYAFNATVTGPQWDFTITQEGRFVFTLVPFGAGQYGISYPLTQAQLAEAA